MHVGIPTQDTSHEASSDEMIMHENSYFSVNLPTSTSTPDMKERSHSIKKVSSKVI